MIYTISISRSTIIMELHGRKRERERRNRVLLPVEVSDDSLEGLSVDRRQLFDEGLELDQLLLVLSFFWPHTVRERERENNQYMNFLLLPYIP